MVFSLNELHKQIKITGSDKFMHFHSMKVHELIKCYIAAGGGTAAAPAAAALAAAALAAAALAA